MAGLTLAGTALDSSTDYSSSSPDFSDFNYSSGNLDAIAPPVSSSSASAPSSDASGDGFLSSLGHLLPSIMTSVTSLYKTANPPRPTAVSPGSYVYNPQSGTYQPAVSYNSGLSSINPVFIVVAIAIVAIMVLRK